MNSTKKRESSMVVVTNPKHPMFNLRGKVQESSYFANLKEDEIPVLINDELLFFNKRDISDTACKKKLRVPKSRKEFYSFVQDERTKKIDIIEVIEMMTQTKDEESGKMLFSFNPPKEENMMSFSKENLISLIDNPEVSKAEIIETIRIRRDEGLVEFNLPNNNISAGFNEFKSEKKKSQIKGNKKKGLK